MEALKLWIVETQGALIVCLGVSLALHMLRDARFARAVDQSRTDTNAEIARTLGMLAKLAVEVDRTAKHATALANGILKTLEDDVRDANRRLAEHAERLREVEGRIGL